jgi:hypothetical protein
MGDTTGFSEDAVTMINHSRDQIFAPMGSNVADTQTLASFLAKPAVVSSFSWNTAQARNSLIYSESIINLLSAQTAWTKKLSGYRYMRATAVIRIELDVQPFIAGRLLVHFLPQFTARQNNVAYASKNQTLCSKTQQYSIEIDARDSVATLRIPYISPYSHANIFNYASESDWGNIFISVLSPCVSLANVSVPITVLLSFEDAQFEAPTAQSGNRKINTVLKKERKNMADKGVISSTLDALVSPIQYFKNVPFVGEFVGTATSVLKGTAGIFEVFGFAKPVDNRVPMLVSRKPLRDFGNFNGADQSSRLALDASSSLQQYGGLGGLQEDEMSFSYLKSIPAYVDHFVWNTSSSAESTLYSKEISPLDLTESRANNLGGALYTLEYGPPFVYLSRFFKYYRGSINIHLKFVKTQFHIGKVLITYDDLTAPSTPNTSTTALREVVDLKDSSEITLNLPYLSNSSYLPVDIRSGTLRVQVLNPLLASSTVSSSIDVLVYYSAGEDYEVGCINDAFGTSAVAQMNVVSKELVTKRIGGYSETPLSLVPVQSSMGEAFVSLKQLLLLGRFVNRTSAFFTATNFPSFGHAAIGFWPWMFGMTRGVSNATMRFEVPPLSGDYLSEFAQGFAFYRGGIRYLTPSNATGTYAAVYTVNNESLAPSSTVCVSNYISVPAMAMNRINPVQEENFPRHTMRNTIVNHCDENTLDFTVPYFGSTPMRFTHMTVGQNPTIPITTDVNPDLVVAYTPVGNSSVLTERGLMRAAADDFSFIYFCGFSGWFPNVD